MNVTKLKKHSFFLYKEGTSCYCVNETIAKVPSANCNLPCAKNGGSCGGNNFYSLYSGSLERNALATLTCKIITLLKQC